MFLSEISTDNGIKRNICQNLVAFMAMDGHIDASEKEQITNIYIEAFGDYKIDNIALDLLTNITKEKLKDSFSKILSDYPLSNDIVKVKKVLFELLSCALCNGQYNDDKKEIIEEIANNFSIDISIIKEMKDMINTILILNKKSKELIYNERS